jgi:hypothetical protein
MEAYFMRLGVQGAHKEEMDKTTWDEVCAQVRKWDAAQRQSLVARALGKAKMELIDEEERIMRKQVRDMIQRSERAYAALFDAMPAELQPQVEHIPGGYAYGLWRWLENKFQSTEVDTVNDLIQTWMELKMEENETFDAYRARVVRIHTLLVQAKEKPSTRQYAYKLLDKLQPRYKQAVLALKASGKLAIDDANNKQPNWDEIAAFVNAHERDVLRLEGETAEGEAASVMAARVASPREEGAGGNKQKQGERYFDGECFFCGKRGHRKSECRAMKRRQAAEENAPSPGAPRVQHGQASMVKTANRYEPISGSDAEEENNVRAPYARALMAAHTPTHTPTWAERFQTHHKERALVAGNATGAAQQPRPLRRLIRPGEQRHNANPTDAVAPQLQPQRRIAAKSVKAAAPVDAKQQRDLGKQLADDSAGVDSMCSVHVSGNRKVLHNLRRCEPISVQVADGAWVRTDQCGTMELRVANADRTKEIKITLQKVYFNERFSANLLSWGVLRENGYELHSTSDGTHIITPGGNKIRCSTRGRVTVLHPARQYGQRQPERAFGAIAQPKTRCADDLVRLHEKLGHAGFDRLIKIIKGGNTLDIAPLCCDDSLLQDARRRVLECVACTRGKGTRTPFGHAGLDHGNGTAEVLHMDSFEVNSPDPSVEKKYGVTIKDPYSGARWMVDAATKGVIAQRVIDTIKEVQVQHNKRVRRVYTDGGSEFRGVEHWCKQQGITFTPAPPRTPQLDGIAERDVRTVKDAARTLLQHANLPAATISPPVEWWKHAMNHFICVWNRTHIAPATGVTPYETVRGQRPSIKHFGVFGCDVWCHVQRQHRTTFDPKMEPGVYLGHDTRHNCAKVFLLESRKIIATRDVEFREHSFRHAAAVSSDQSWERMQYIVQGGYHAEEVLATYAPEQETDATAHSRAPQGVSKPSEDSDSQRDERKYSDLTSEPDPETTDGIEKFTVEQLLAKRIVNHQPEYLVKWQGYPEEQATWQRGKQLREDGCQESIDTFEEKCKAELAVVTATAARHAPLQAPEPSRVQTRSRISTKAVHWTDEEEDDSSPIVNMVMGAIGLPPPHHRKQPLNAEEEEY